MQIIDLYIRDTFKYESVAEFPTVTRLVDTSTIFTDGRFKVGQIIVNLDSGVEGVITAIAPQGNVNALDIDGGSFSGTGQRYQIYNDFTKLELFKDESVSITDTIQNVKDPAKIFAPFSQQFSVPASKHNNKFFHHYYNVNVLNSYDARFEGDAIIQLNGTNYKKGSFRLTSVDLKNNVAYSYKLVFTGETIEFKKILAENELSSLFYPESVNFDYTNSFVRGRFGASFSVTPTQQDLLFPLITHSKNMRYNNGVYRDHITDTELNYTDLKPALRVKTIIDAIEETYPDIKFSQQFFNSYRFKQLYMWLHKEEGYISNAEEGGELKTISARFKYPGPNGLGQLGLGYHFQSGTELRPAFVRTLPADEDETVTTDTGYVRYRYKFVLVVTAPTTRSYTIECRKAFDNSLLWSNDRTGTQTFDWIFDNQSYSGDFTGTNILDFYINIITDNTLSISQELTVEYNKRYFGTGSGGQFLAQGVYELPAVVDEDVLSINNIMPKMKIFDFLKNIFTAFNLTAYKEGDTIIVLPLDDYYNAGNVYDITKYVDTTKSKVSKLLQFKNMKFDFKSKKSYLVQYSEELQGNIFSEESYGNDAFDGKDYKIEVDFEKMMYERLSDEETGDLTDIQQGAMLDKKFEPTIGQPLLFYPIWTETSDPIKFDNLDGSTTDLIRYYRPSNSIVNLVTGFASQTFNFGIEADEYTGQGGITTQDTSNDLFSKYYRNYVANLFSRNARKTNVSAYLPLNVILNYRLNDIFIIGTTEYRINSIKTNLLTNKSDLELYNLQANTSQSLNGQRQELERVQNLETTNKTSSSISIQWDAIQANNVYNYEIYLDDEFYDEVYPGTTEFVNNLESDTTYKISVRALYNIGTDFASSFDTDLFETTL